MTDMDYNFDDDVSLAEDEKNVGGNKQDWLKMSTKGQTLRVSFVYFYTYDANAVSKAMKDARKSGKSLSKEDIQEVAKKSLAARAQELSKSVDALTVTDRLDVSVAHFKKMQAHYQEGMGYVLSRLGKDGADADAIWKRLPEPKSYFSTLLLVYPTDGEGNLNKEAFANQAKAGTLKLIPWRFSNSVYESIWKLNNGLRENSLSLASQDIKLECKEPQYQKIDVSAAGPALWLRNDTVRQQVLSRAAGLYDKLLPFREMTTEQLKAKLGLGGGGSVEDVSSTDFQDMLDSV